MPEAKPITLAAVIGERVRALRESLGDSQDDLARGVRDLGLNWQRSTVAALEAGTRGLSVEELVVLCRLLRAAPHELVGTDEEVSLGPHSTARGDAVRRLLTGESDFAADDFDSRFDRDVRRGLKAGDELDQAMQHLWPRSRLDQRVAAYRASTGEAEQKLARRLNVDRWLLSIAAYRLWGRSLSEERDARVSAEAPPDATIRQLQALRGHVTRSLAEELGGDRLQAARSMHEQVGVLLEQIKRFKTKKEERR